jgi:hypothetical protein
MNNTLKLVLAFWLALFKKAEHTCQATSPLSRASLLYAKIVMQTCAFVVVSRSV